MDDDAGGALKKNILSRMLSKQAYERLSRVRSVKPELAAQLETYMVTLFQSGQIKTEITDDQLKQILDKVTRKKQFTIRRA
ncbi:MAG: DNA-binding protein [Candidatus Aenigmarchaeota archaeon]|nr:DNA-binding protein [Candidatus Aenigmarchaeota archaeon]